MKLTSQEEYGLRCMLHLARTPGAQSRVEADTAAVTLAQIAETEGLSTEYAGKLMGILARSELVESVRGRHGGYRLTRPPDVISVAQTLAALGSKFYSADTCDRFSGEQTFCVHNSACSIRSLWSGMQLLLDHVLTRTTLQDLVSLSERNVAGWMRSHLDAIRTLEPLGNAFGPSEPRDFGGTNVVLRAEKRTK